MADFRFESHGSIWLCHPLNDPASNHLKAHTADDAQWFGGALVVEPRYVEGLADALAEAGFEVE
jgi:hypothetical protein